MFREIRVMIFRRLPRSKMGLAGGASLGAAGLVLHDESQSTPAIPKEKSSIYPSPTPEIVLLDTPSALEKRIGMVRRTSTEMYQSAFAQVHDAVSRWIGVEKAVESRIKSFRDPTEPLTPGLLYVGISTLTGSILARTRSLPIRIFLPPAFLLISFAQFLPNTASNVGAYAEELEDRFIPTFGEKRRIGVAHSRMAWEQAKEAFAKGQQATADGIKNVVETIQHSTGLKLEEALGWASVVKDDGKEVARIAKEDLKEVLDSKHSAEVQDEQKKHV